MLQRSYADDHDLAVGDEVDVEVPVGQATWPVSVIVEDNPVIFVPVVTTLTTMADAGFEPADNALIVFAEPGGRRWSAGAPRRGGRPSCRSSR